jgi:hypothetical protein
MEEAHGNASARQGQDDEVLWQSCQKTSRSIDEGQAA